MNDRRRTRRDVLKVFGAAPLALAASMPEGQTPAGRAGGGRGRGLAPPAFDGVLTPSPTATPGGKPLLTLYSISLQWADYDEAADTAAKAGWPAIGWTVRNGGHVSPENVVRDLPRAVGAAKKAGLKTPIISSLRRDNAFYSTQMVEAGL